MCVSLEIDLSLTTGFDQVFQDGNSLFQEFLGEGNVAQEFSEVSEEFVGNNIGDGGESLEGVVDEVEELMRHQEFLESTEEFRESLEEFWGVQFSEGGEGAEHFEEGSLEFFREEVAELVEGFDEVLVEVFIATREGITDGGHEAFEELHKLFREEVLDLLDVLGSDSTMVTLSNVVFGSGNL